MNSFAKRQPAPSQLPERPLRLPRYTSFPTAVQFQDIGEERYRPWLKAVDQDETISLYLHIPFCDQLCWFCGCLTKVTNRYAPVHNYVDSLLKEIRMVHDQLGRRAVGHIHFGGGSPSLLSPEDFRRIMATLTHCFDIQDDADIAVEIDPRTVDDDKIDTYRNCGVNRVSLGIQDFNLEVQQNINRVQSLELVATVISKLRQVGIKHINMDLLYGLPYQTVQSVTETVTIAMAFMPSRIALFGYAHVPWMRKHQKLLETAPLPDSEQRMEMFKAMQAVLAKGRYLSIGIDHFARPEDPLSDALADHSLRRNFQGYTVDKSDTLIAFGVSAISSLDNGYAQNTTDFKAYQEAINAGKLPITRGVGVSADDRLRRDIISELMCYFEVTPERVAARHQQKMDFSSEWQYLKPLEDAGYVKCHNGHLQVTPKGRPYVRGIATVFDPYFPIKGNVLLDILRDE